MCCSNCSRINSCCMRVCYYSFFFFRMCSKWIRLESLLNRILWSDTFNLLELFLVKNRVHSSDISCKWPTKTCCANATFGKAAALLLISLGWKTLQYFSWFYLGCWTFILFFSETRWLTLLINYDGACML